MRAAEGGFESPQVTAFSSEEADPTETRNLIWSQNGKLFFPLCPRTRYPNGNAGFLSNVATVLKELAPQCDPEKLIEVVTAEAALPHVQRLGYLLDLVGSKELSEPLVRWVANRRPDWVRLQPGQSARRARRERRWRLLVNTRVEPDI